MAIIMTQHVIAKYQDRCHKMKAPPGVNLKPKKRKGKHTCTKPALRDSSGIAQSKTLRKRERALRARQQDHMTTINSDNTIPPGAYRKPGSMKK